MNSKILLLGKLSLFLLLSIADFGLTRHLIMRGDGVVYESNPVAAWWLSHHGWLGLAAFKLAVALSASVLALAVWRQRPRLGHGLLIFGCLVIGSVVGYSTYLAVHPESAVPSEIGNLQATGQHLKTSIDTGHSYREALIQASTDLRAGRITLTHAVDRLAATDKAADPNWQRLLRQQFLDLDHRGCLAANIVMFALDYDKAPSRFFREFLRHELTKLCGVDVIHELESRQRSRAVADQVPLHEPRGLPHLPGSG